MSKTNPHFTGHAGASRASFIAVEDVLKATDGTDDTDPTTSYLWNPCHPWLKKLL